MAEQALQTQAPLTEGGAFLAVIAAAARDPQVDVGKMQALLAMRERIMEKEAEIAYNEAMARLQPKLPRIVKGRKIEVKGSLRSKYAAYEDIDKVVRPLLDEEGFSVSYTTEQVGKETKIIMTIRHKLGHKECSEITLPFDKSEFRSEVQSLGSTVSFGKRYALCLALNIVTVNEDDDGQAAGWLKPDQLKNVEEMILACEMTPTQHAAFLKFAEADTLKEIRARAYDRVMAALRAKEKQHREGAK